MKSKQPGFTIVELLITIAIGTLIILALHQVLQLQTQSIRAQTAQISVQQANRATLGVLSGELREVDAAAGDLLLATTDSLKVRVVRKLGLVCAPDTVNARLNVWSVGDAFAAGDSVAVFADVDTMAATDDVWRTGRITGVDTLLTILNCPSKTLGDQSTTRRRLTFGSTAQVSGVHRGAIVRAYSHLTYGIYSVDGAWVIGRREAASDVLPLIGPVRAPADGGLRFTYYDTLGAIISPSTATQRAAVRRIAIKVRAVNDPTAQVFSDSLVTQVFLRNE